MFVKKEQWLTDVSIPFSFVYSMRTRDTNKPLLHLVNQARALRVAEIINDYRTLLLHICEETIPSPIEEYFEEGHVIMREGHTAAQALMGSNYTPAAVPSNASNEEAERAELQRCVPSYKSLNSRGKC